MDKRVIVKEQHVSAGDIDPKDVRCPRCRSNTLVLHGNSQIGRRELLEQGVITKVEIDPVSHIFELETMECLACEIRFILKPREVITLEMANLRLRQMLIEVTGKDPLARARPC